MRKSLELKNITRQENDHLFDDRIAFVTIKDHILESICSCYVSKFEAMATSTNTSTNIRRIGIKVKSSGDSRNNKDQICEVCKYEKELTIPHIPEMVFARNCLKLYLLNEQTDLMIEFNALDGLKLVECGRLPNVKVGPSSVWQEARRSLPIREFQQPFDWTYSSEYCGTLGPGLHVVEEPSTERINFEKLKRIESILFCDEIILYEDELADHGISRMMVQIRVMPTTFYILCRFFLRVDHVMLKICDTRIYGEAGKNYLIREWSKREALFSELNQHAKLNVLNDRLIYDYLPETEFRSAKLQYNI